MNPEKKDRRIRRTEKQLEDALLELLKTKSISKISVRELTDAADITRATFYKHYRDPDDMLSKLQEQMMNTILELINQTTRKDPMAFFYSLFDYFKNEVSHPELLFINTTEGSASTRIGKAIIEHYMLMWSEGKVDVVEQDYIYYRTYTVNGCINVVESWVLRGMKEDPDHMAKLCFSFLPYSRVKDI